LGFGYDSFWTADRIEDISREEQWGVNQAHSAYIDELLSLGIPGLFLFVAMLWGGLFVAVVRYYATGSDALLAATGVLAFATLDALTESIVLEPVSIGFVTTFLIAVLGFGPRVATPARRAQPAAALA
jgi:O-antigen ligase